MKDKNQEMKEMQNVVENIVSDLTKQGIKVNSAAILNIETANPNQEKSIKKVIDQAINYAIEQAVNKINNNSSVNNNSNINNTDLPRNKGISIDPEKIKVKEKCFCPSCFNFNTFEKVLSDEVGVFDKAELNLGGKKFHLKAFIGGNGEHYFMIEALENINDNTNWTSEQIQAGLSEAIKNKDYVNAQIFMDKLNNFKNQNNR